MKSPTIVTYGQIKIAEALMLDCLDAEGEFDRGEEQVQHDIFARIVDLDGDTCSAIISLITGVTAMRFARRHPETKGKLFGASVCVCENNTASSQIVSAQQNEDEEMVLDLILATRRRGEDALADATWHALARWRALHLQGVI